MSEPIHALSRSIAVLRHTLVELHKGAPAREVHLAAPAMRPKAEVGGTRKQHLALLPKRLAGLRQESLGSRQKKALRFFVEAVLLDELGDDLQLSGDFADLVERVADALESSAPAQEPLAAALNELLGADASSPSSP